MSTTSAGPQQDHTQPPRENVLDSPATNNSSDHVPPAEKSQQDVEKTRKKKNTLAMVSIFVTMFIVGLDRTIVSTAIPEITNEFHALPDVGWYASSYLITGAAFQLFCGKLYTVCRVKTVLLSSIVIFEAASALCGAAPTSTAFIVGRSIAGLGSAGIFAGAIVTVTHIVPLKNRPPIQGAFGALFGIASIVGPLIGGAFTTHVTWRWCFYINLPLGGVSIVAVLLLLDIPDDVSATIPIKEKLAQLDFLGTAMLVPAVVCLGLALQWGGQAYAWSSGRVIALLVIMSVLFLGFGAVQVFMPRTATIPPRVFKNRSIIGGAWINLAIGASQFTFYYFLPLWFQAVQGVSAYESGIRLLPLMLSTVIAAIMGGLINLKIGYYTPLAIIGACGMAVSAGLLITLQVHTSQAKWVGYSFLFGYAGGLVFQAPNLAAQTVLAKEDAPIGLALMLFTAQVSPAIFVAVGENVLGAQLLKRLSWMPGFNKTQILQSGLTSLLGLVPADQRARAIFEYNEALRVVFWSLGLIPACLSVLGAVALEWETVKKEELEEEKNNEKSQDADVERNVGLGAEEVAHEKQ